MTVSDDNQMQTRAGAQQFGPLVGRQHEIEQLSSLLDGIHLGRGAVALIGGEAGVGKTRLCHELNDRASDRGIAVAWERHHEGHHRGIGSVWTELLERLIEQLPDLESRASTATATNAISQLARSGHRTPASTVRSSRLSTRDAELRLVNEIAQTMTSISRATPVVLILDDLHWADTISLELFGHLARSAGDCMLLIAATYRDVELSIEHPLTAHIASVRRERHAQYIPLRALKQQEIHELAQAVAIGGVTFEWSSAIWKETAGNPFLAGELIRHLVDVEAFASPIPTGQGGIDLRLFGIPEGIRHIIAVRMRRLSNDAILVLTSASVCSSGVDFAVLQVVTELDDESLLTALDVALDAHFLRAQPGKQESYQFVHEIARKAIYGAQSPSRRVRAHRRMAEAIIQVHPGTNTEHAAEIAFQFHESSTIPGASAGIDYALAAASRAQESFARDRAVELLRIARDLAKEEPPGRRLGILMELALAETDAIFVADARRTIAESLSLIEELDLSPDIAAALLAATAGSLKDGGADGAEWNALVDEGLRHVTSEDRLTWARLTLLRERFEQSSAGLINAARWLGNDPMAVYVARTEGNEYDFARTLQPFDQFHPTEVTRLIGEIETWNRPDAVIRGLTVTGAALLYHFAEFRQARQHFLRLLDVSERFGSIAGQAEAHVRLALIYCALGEFTNAQDSAARARELVTRLLAGHRLNISLVWVDAYLAEYLGGDWRSIAEALIGITGDPRIVKRTIVLDDAALAALALVRSGQNVAAQRMIDELTPLIAEVDSRIALANGAVAFGGTAVWALEAVKLAPVFLGAATRLISDGVRGFPCTSLELTAARMATLIGDHVAARDWYQAARVMVDREGQIPLRAIIDLDEARALRGSPGTDHQRIESLFESARATFNRLDMQDWSVFCDVSMPKAMREHTNYVPARPAGLTLRELEVLQLVSRGYSDRQISEELFLSPRTVNAHIRNMLAKTNNSNRTELSVWAIRNVGGISSTQPIIEPR